MVKRKDEKIEIYEDIYYYKMYYIIGIITFIFSGIFILQLLTKGNKEYIGTYICCGVLTLSMIGVVVIIKYCKKKKMSVPKLEVIITKEYIEFFSVKETEKVLKKIYIKNIQKVFTYVGYLVIHSVNENNEKEKFSYSFGKETSNLYIAEKELKKLLKEYKCS